MQNMHCLNTKTVGNIADLQTTLYVHHVCKVGTLHTRHTL